MKVNRRNAERELTMKLHHNFDQGDMHVTLTYAGDIPTVEDARKEERNFLRRLRRHFKKENRILKWIMVTEYHNKRIHHHMIINKMDAADLARLWTAGRIKISVIDDTGDYRNLASYLIKETDKTFRDPEAYSKQRYSCSRTVVSPDRKVEQVRLAEVYRDPKPIKGYRILEDSIYRGENPVTGISYMEYMLLSVDPDPRLKVWRRGERKKYRERTYDPTVYKREVDGQIEMDLTWPGYWKEE